MTKAKSKAAAKRGKKTAKAKARPISAQRKLLLGNVAASALNEGTARNVAIAAIKAAGGNDPLVRREYIAGRIGAGLRRLGSNLPDKELIASGYAIIDMAGKDAAKVADGQSRRSPEQERLYGAARVAWASVMRDAGIGANKAKDTSKSRKARHGSNDNSKAKAKPVNLRQALSPKVADGPKAVAHVSMAAAALLSFSNRNAKVMPPALITAIQDFSNAVKGVKLS